MIFEFNINLVLSIIILALLVFLLYKEIKNKNKVDYFVNLTIGFVGLIAAFISFIDTGFDFHYFYNLMYLLVALLSIGYIVLTIIKLIKEKKRNKENIE